MPITTLDLFSIETINSLIVEPLFRTSRVLPFLRRVDTKATDVYLPQVTGGSAAWLQELEEFPDAGIDASELKVTPKKCGCIQIASHESVEDANAAEILGAAITDALAKETDRAFALGAGPKGPTGLPGLTGVSTVTGDTKTMGVYADAIGKIEQAGGSPSVIFASTSRGRVRPRAR
jgi:HK97 family phage major capsid protein